MMLGLLLLLTTLEAVYAAGVIEVRFVRYNNPDGEGDNGNKCDGLFVASSECDQYFKLCLDTTYSGDDSMSSCTVGEIQTGKVGNQDSFDFTADIGGTTNPVQFRFSQWYPGGIRIKVDVWDDDDSNSHDHVELLPPRTINTVPSTQRAGASEYEVIISGRTSLTLRVKTYCDPYYYGRGCSTFCRPQNSDTQGHYDCSPAGSRQCHSGWRGYNCDLKDGCASSPCQNGGQCQVGQQSGDYDCVCGHPYTGLNCEAEVTIPVSVQPSSPSQPPETAPPVPETTEYMTSAALKEELTEMPTTPTPRPQETCDSVPCRNGATCRPGRGDDSYSCVCVPGYEGRRCERQTDNCVGVSCGQYGRCENGINTYSCLCVSGWNGSRCDSDINECDDAEKCKNGDCVNSLGSYNCTCSEGWTGEDCGSDIDECQAGSACANGGNCTNNPGSFNCICVPGYTGAVCEQKVECPCENGGSCEFLPSGVRCLCPVTWTGVFCQQPICDSKPCRNQGTCNPTPQGFTCECPVGFTGDYCQTNINECLSEPCRNGALCVDDVNSYKCICSPGFIGSRCDRLEFLVDPERPVKFIFRGSLSEDDVTALKIAVVDVIADGMGVPNKNLSLSEKVDTCKTSKGQLATVFEYQIRDSQNKVIPWYNVEELLDEAREKGKFALPRPLHDGTGCASFDGGKTQSSTQGESSEWKTILIVIVGLLCVLLVALIVGFALYYRHQKRGEDTGLSTNPLFRYEPVTEDTMPKDSGRTPRNFRCHSEEIPGTKFNLEDEED